MRLSHKASMMFLFSAMLKEQYEDLIKGIIPRVTVFDVKNGIIEFLSHGKFEVRKVKKEKLKINNKTTTAYFCAGAASIRGGVGGLIHSSH